MISILEKKRAPSGSVFHKGLGWERFSSTISSQSFCEPGILEQERDLFVAVLAVVKRFECLLVAPRPRVIPIGSVVLADEGPDPDELYWRCLLQCFLNQCLVCHTLCLPSLFGMCDRTTMVRLRYNKHSIFTIVRQAPKQISISAVSIT